MTWMPNFDEVAQCSHVFIASTIVLAWRLWVGRGTGGIVAVIVYGLLKEFIFDLLVEGDSVRGSAQDFAWYIVGAISASLAVRWMDARKERQNAC